MHTKTIKIQGVPDNYATLPFGRQIEYRTLIEDFKRTAKKEWISQKGKDGAKEIKKFIKSVGAKEYFCARWDEPNYRDDSFEFFYK